MNPRRFSKKNTNSVINTKNIQILHKSPKILTLQKDGNFELTDNYLVEKKTKANLRGIKFAPKIIYNIEIKKFEKETESKKEILIRKTLK